MHSTDPCIIIGAGPAGLTAGYELEKHDMPCIIVEKEAHTVGGIARTTEYKQWRFDIGGHRFFTKVDRVMTLWKEILGDDFLRCKRLSRIYFHKRFFYYPMRPLDVLKKLGSFRSSRALLSFAKAQLFPIKNEISFRDYIVNHFGTYLYTIFFQHYTEKVWGIPCEQIRADWAAQRIKGMSLGSAIKTAFFGNKKQITSLIDSFYYPRLGPGMMWEKLRDRLQASGQAIFLFHSIPVRIEHDGERVKSITIRNSATREETTLPCSAIISSMPLRELIPLFSPALTTELQEAARRLRYRDFLLVALVLKKQDIFPDNWIYIHDPDVDVARIQNFKNWSLDMVEDPTTTCLGMEYFTFTSDPLWMASDDALLKKAADELERIGLGKKADVVDGHVVRMEKTYPIYDESYHEVIKTIQNGLSPLKNLYPVGRNGMHRYNNQDHSMLTAMLAVENLLGANHNLWEVNTERVYHEEDHHV